MRAIKKKWQMGRNLLLIYCVVGLIILQATEFGLGKKENTSIDEGITNCEDIAFNEIGSWDTSYGLLQDIAIYENGSHTYAFLITSSEGLYIFDITNSSNPIKLHQHFKNQSMSKIKILENYVYILVDSYNLNVYNFDNLHEPVLVSTYKESCNIQDFQFYNEIIIIECANYSYLNDDDDYQYFIYEYFTFLNYSDISNPQIISNYFDPEPFSKTRFFGFEVEGDILYTSDPFLMYINITNVKNPFLINKTQIRSFNLLKENDLIFLDNLTNINVFNIANLTNPILLHTLEDPSNMKIIKEKLFLFSWSSLRMYDFNDSSSIIMYSNISDVTEVFPSGYYFDNTCFSNNSLIFLSARGFSIYDISDLEDIILRYHFTQTGLSRDISIRGSIAFIANGYSGLQILNCTDNNNPVLIYEFQTRDFCRQVCINDNTAYLAVGNHLQILDITNLSHPIEINFITYFMDTHYQRHAMYAEDNILYVASRFRGCIGETGNYLNIYNATNPSNLIKIGYFGESTFGENWYPQHEFGSTIRGSIGLQIIDNRAYICDGYYDLYILDISEFDNIVKIGGYRGEYMYSCNVQIVDELAILGDSHLGLHLLDISNLNDIKHIDTYYTNESTKEDHYSLGIQSVYYSEGYVYACDLNDGLLILDITKDKKFELKGQFYDDGLYCDASVNEDLIYLVCEEEGFKILQVSGLPLKTPQSLAFRLQNYLSPVFVILILIQQVKRRKSWKTKNR